MSRVLWLDIPSSLDAPPREERGGAHMLRWRKEGIVGR